ncbi:MAG: hypothetical protein IJA87_06530 [Clostridia bacterium]|nr:hypothetical protein [Clostridia bacterium]
MSIIKVLVVAVVACFFIALLNQHRPEFSLLIRIVTVVFIVMLVSTSFAEISEDLLDFSNELKINNEYILLIVKALIIAISCNVVAEICADSGNRAIAFCVDMTGRAAIALLTVPLLKAIFQFSKELINE